MTRILTTLLLALVASALAPAQQQRLSLTAAFEPAHASPGDEVTLVVKGVIDDGYHIYGAMNSAPTVVSFTSLGGLEKLGETQIPDGEEHHVYADEYAYWIEREIVIRQRFRVPASGGGDLVVRGTVDYEPCTATFCEDPAKAPFAVAVNGGSVELAVDTPQDPQGTQEPVETQDPREFDANSSALVVATRARFEPVGARVGEVVTLVFDVDITDPEYHIYGEIGEGGVGVLTEVVLREGSPLEPYSELVIPEGDPHDNGFGGFDLWLSGGFELKQQFVVKEGAAAGPIEVKLALRFMACTETNCLDPEDVGHTVPLRIESGDTREGSTPGEVDGPVVLGDARSAGGGKGAEASSPEGEEEGGLWALIIASVLGGLVALAMPCTYPMIPITFSFFTKQAEARGGKVLPLALVYGAGIIVVFALIGLLFGRFIVDFATHEITNLVIGVAFLYFALVLFGVAKLELPNFVNNAAAKAGGVGGYFGVFLMGTTLVVTSFTCTAPIAGALLAQSANSADLGRVVLGMSVFGATMAAPFVLLALLPGRKKVMPKSGAWMDTLKVTLGFVELAACIKFFSNVDVALQWKLFPNEAFYSVWGAIFVVTGLFLLGLVKWGYYGGGPLSKTRVIFAVLFFGLAGYSFYGTFGRPMDFVMTAMAPGYTAHPAGGVHIYIKDDHETTRSVAESLDRLVLVNFTGFT